MVRKVDRVGDPRTSVFIENLKAGLCLRDAAYNAGYGNNPATATSLASKLVKDPGVMKLIDEAGINENRELAEVRKRLHDRQATALVRKMVTHIAEGDTHEIAAAKAGYQGHNANTLKAAASRALSNPNHIKTIKDVLDRHGITDDRLAEVIDEGLGAMRPIVVSGGKEAATVEMHEDHFVRGVFADKALKLRGHYKNVEGEGGPMVVRISNAVKDGLTATQIEISKQGQIGEGGNGNEQISARLPED